jgi:hypothetical protein
MLGYRLSDSYQGTVRMTYDAGARAYVYLLPAVRASDLAGQAGHLNAGIIVTDRSGTGPRPSNIAVASVSSCMPVSNG